MIILLEAKKLKRSGFGPTFFIGGLLAAAFPIINMSVRTDHVTSQLGDPLEIMFSEHWQMMSLLNILIIICGTCMMYYTEYANQGLQKMAVLPIRLNKIFFGKFILVVLAFTMMVLLETIVLSACAYHWFSDYIFDGLTFIKFLSFQIAISLPTIILMLLIASLCRNVWLSLGIGVILVFTLSFLPQTHTAITLLPFNSPYQTLAAVRQDHQTLLYLSICLIEMALCASIKFFLPNERRFS